MGNKELFFASVDMVERQFDEEQEYWDLKDELDKLGLKYVDYGNAFPQDSIPKMRKVLNDFKRRHKRRTSLPI